MKLLSFIATLAIVYAQYYDYEEYEHTYTIDEIRTLAAVLESALNDVNANISSQTAQNAISQGRINDIRDFFLPNINLVNTQQSALLDGYTAQVKALQHRADEARAQKNATAQLQGSLMVALDQLATELNETAADNDSQNTTISSLESSINETKSSFISDLGEAIGNLTHNLDEVENKTGVLAGFVDSRRCEHGTRDFSLDDDTDTSVNFTTQHNVPPTVVVAVTGFETKLDVHSYDHYDGLSLDVYATNITTTGFTVSTKDISEGMVEVTKVSCSYIACHGFDQEVEIHPEEEDTDPGSGVNV